MFSSASTPDLTKGKKKEEGRKSHRLVLCFDGTGKRFTGEPSDTNIVMIYRFCDRTEEGQFHYYQPGIGTYHSSSVVLTAEQFDIGNVVRKVSEVADSALATTFDHHVIAGYRFIMRYYKEGYKIYMFGFSRGAFVARFLASMISHVGLLSKGNEEMVPFAYKAYMNHNALGVQAPKMDVFKSMFCRPSVQVEFLGLFDTVASVARFDLPLTAPKSLPTSMFPVAKHIRHAVSLDERRIKFRPALFDQEKQQVSEAVEQEKSDNQKAKEKAKALYKTRLTEVGTNQARRDRVEKLYKESMEELAGPGPYELYMNLLNNQTKGERTLKEVWFVGDHGDIGGGWPIDTYNNKATGIRVAEYQFSDIALQWMLSELQETEKSNAADDRLKFTPEMDEFMEKFDPESDNYTKALLGRLHDQLQWHGNSYRQLTPFETLGWWFLECLPIFKRLELEKGKWNNVIFPLNLGDSRDIPYHRAALEGDQDIIATLHPSVHRRWAMEQGLPSETVKVEPRPYPRDNQLGWGAAINNKIPPKKAIAGSSRWFKRGITWKKLPGS